MRYRLLVLALVAFVFLVVVPMLTTQETFTVDSTCDNVDADPGDGECEDSGGDCCVRAAIGEVNARDLSDTIAFGIAGAGPHTITLGSELPVITADVTIDGTTQPGTVCGTYTDFSDAVWKIRIDADGADMNIFTFGLGTTAVVRGLELVNDLPTAEYGITLHNGIARCNRVHGMRGGIAIGGETGTIGGSGINDANWAYNNSEFGFTTRATASALIEGNVGCVGQDGESSGGSQNYGIYVEGGVDTTIRGGLIAGCEQAGVLNRADSEGTVIEDLVNGPTLSGATTLCFEYVAYEDEADDTVYTDNTECPIGPGCCNVTGLEEFDVTCIDYNIGHPVPYSAEDCEFIASGAGGATTGWNADGVCAPSLDGVCPSVGTPTNTPPPTGTPTPLRMTPRPASGAGGTILQTAEAVAVGAAAHVGWTTRPYLELAIQDVEGETCTAVTVAVDVANAALGAHFAPVGTPIAESGPFPVTRVFAMPGPVGWARTRVTAMTGDCHVVSKWFGTTP